MKFRPGEAILELPENSSMISKVISSLLEAGPSAVGGISWFSGGVYCSVKDRLDKNKCRRN